MKKENKVSKGLTILKNELRRICNDGLNGGAVPFKDIAFFEHIPLDRGVIYYVGEVEGIDGTYKLIVCGVKK